MRLAVRTDYALRVLMYLALAGNRAVPVADIARSYGISAPHLMKVAQRLAELGYIEAVRGRCGGLRLAQPSRAINLGDVVRNCETDFNLVECMAPSGRCAIEQPCRLRRALARARDAFLAELDRLTLAELVRPNRPLRVSLGLTG